MSTSTPLIYKLVFCSTIPLQTVRPMVFKTIAITDLKNVDLAELDMRRLNQAVKVQGGGRR
jgi:hypothetical protein